MMKTHSSTFKTGDIVIVSFPFTDTNQTKNRPALVISDDKNFNEVAHHMILAMITSTLHTAWPLDIVIADLESCGLIKSSLIRFKLFTLDNHLIKGKIGHLTTVDQKKVKKHFKQAFYSFLT